jgi:hypothetical protein
MYFAKVSAELSPEPVLRLIVFTHSANHRIQMLDADLHLAVSCQLETMYRGSLGPTLLQIPSLLAVLCVAGLTNWNYEGYGFEEPLSGIDLTDSPR